MNSPISYTVTGPAVSGLRPFSIEVPYRGDVALGIPEWVSTASERERGRILPIDNCRVDISWTVTPLPTDGTWEANGTVFHADLYPGERGQQEALTLWVVHPYAQHTCVSPPEWGEVSHPYRYVLYGSPRYVDKRHYRLVCSPIPEGEIDPERNARAQLFWSDPEGFADAVNPPCTAERVSALVAELVGLVPEGYSTVSIGPVPSPEATKYPEELEAFFAAMDHYGLTGQTHLFPAAGPIDRDAALDIRSALTARERDVSGRIARSPKPFRHWVTGLFPITARGHWGLAVDVSTGDTRGSVWSYWGGEETLFHEFDSLCEFLAEACAAYRDGSPLRGYVVNTSTGEPRWFLPDKNSGSLLPEPRDL